MSKSRRMSFFSKIFAPIDRLAELVVKEGSEREPAGVELPPRLVGQSDSVRLGVDSVRYQEIMSMLDGIVHPTVVGDNFLELFKTIPEVFWPIDYIAKRISEAHYDIKRVKDDSIVWCNRLNVDQILKTPNPVMSWRELVYSFFVYKLATGNTFLRAAMPDTFTADALKCQYCSNYWVLPAHKVSVVPKEYTYGVPIFGIATKEELIAGYKLDMGPYSGLTIPYYQILHDRDGIPEYSQLSSFMKANSRLMSVKRPIANLIAVYEARNIIYVKRGGLGFIVSQKHDETGTIALDPREKKELRKEVDRNYGVTEGKTPYGITDVPISFVRTNLSIQELMPFEETLEDAVKIAGAFNIPAVLVPRKDQATFSNQETAEQSVYYATIIPAAKTFCETLTTFLGLDKKGYYIDCDFSDVACLQAGQKDKETVKKLALERGLTAFNAGLCTLDDVRAIMHEDSKADILPLFGKLKFEMTPEELETVNKIIITKTSKGESNGQKDNKSGSGDNEEPSV